MSALSGDLNHISHRTELFTAGIGKETVKVLLQHNAKVYIAARNREKTERSIKDLFDETGKEALFIELDLANLKSVKAAAEEFQRYITSPQGPSFW